MRDKFAVSKTSYEDLMPLKGALILMRRVFCIITFTDVVMSSIYPKQNCKLCFLNWNLN